MAFWSAETLRERCEADPSIISTFNRKQVSHGAYQLRMGADSYHTTQRNKKVNELEDNEAIDIPPGQFGLLLTEEAISVPLDSMAFISIRAGYKYKGLVNVSGFHVDPGYTGKLMFSVYNAGSKVVSIPKGEQVFLIWFAELTKPCLPEDRYSKDGKTRITPKDIRKIAGNPTSIAELHRSVSRMKRWLGLLTTGMGTALALILTVNIFLLGRIMDKADEIAANNTKTEQPVSINGQLRITNGLQSSVLPADNKDLKKEKKPKK